MRNAINEERERILNEIDKIKYCTMFTDFMQAGFDQAVERIKIVVNGGTAEDYENIKEKKSRCENCACLIKDSHDSWICDDLEKDIFTISDDECCNN
jgi:hypothetical protein